MDAARDPMHGDAARSRHIQLVSYHVVSLPLLSPEMPKAYCPICTCYLGLPDMRLFGCGHGCCARCISQLAHLACPECRRPFTQDDPFALHVEVLEDANIPEPIETATRRLERVLTGTNLAVAKAAQQSLQVLAEKLGDEGKVNAGVLNAAISLLDKRVAPLLNHITNQRHTIRELMDSVDKGIPLDRDLKTRELQRRLERAEEERDRARQALRAAGTTIAAARENAFAHPEVLAVREERDELQGRLSTVRRQLDVALEQELARKKRNPFAQSATQRENQLLKSRVAELEQRLADVEQPLLSCASSSASTSEKTTPTPTRKTLARGTNPFVRKRSTSTASSPRKRARVAAVPASSQHPRASLDCFSDDDDEDQSQSYDLETPPRLRAAFSRSKSSSGSPAKTLR